MKMKLSVLSIMLTVLLFATGFSSITDFDSDLKGTWVRVGDKLRIQVTEEGNDRLQSFIVAEGDEKFPCEVSNIPIYKNITKVGRNLWRCNFLVVTLGSCTTDYEEGFIQITKTGSMEITCPGFDLKVYTRAKPRYESGNE
jgi:hypothetical protein